MTTYLYIDNYRGFSNSLIPIKRINFLVGENSTGKTSFLNLIEIFSQLHFWALEPQFGLLKGTPKHFLDLVSASSKNKKSFTVGMITVEDNESSKHLGMIITYKNYDGRPLPYRVSVLQNNKMATIIENPLNIKKGEKYKLRIIGYGQYFKNKLAAEESALRTIIEEHHAISGFQIKEINEDRSHHLFFIRHENDYFGERALGERKMPTPFPILNNLIELAPIRTKPKRTYDAPQTEFSPEGEHTPYVIKRNLLNKPGSIQFREFLEKAGINSGLYKAINVKTYAKGPLAPFEVQVVLDKTSLSLENVGYGVSQALPLLVEMFVRPKGSAFTIQQPEVHLHPKAQANFGDLIADLSRTEQKIFFVETHSDFTIDRFRLNIRKNGYIQSQLLFFERKNYGNVANSIPIMENGDLSENQSENYRSFFFNEALAMLN